MRLMCAAWQASPPCSIPNDETTLRQLLKTCASDKKWNRVWPQIKRAWKSVKKNPHILIQNGLLRAYKKQREFSKRQKENASKLWIHRRSHGRAMAEPRHHSGIARAGIALQSSSSPSGVNIPHTPPSGASASPRVNGTNPRAMGTNPRAIKQLTIDRQTKARQYQDPVIPDSERMSPEEMAAVRRANGISLPSDVKSTLQEIAHEEPDLTEERNGGNGA